MGTKKVSKCFRMVSLFGWSCALPLFQFFPWAGSIFKLPPGETRSSISYKMQRPTSVPTKCMPCLFHPYETISKHLMQLPCHPRHFLRRWSSSLFCQIRWLLSDLRYRLGHVQGQTAKHVEKKSMIFETLVQTNLLYLFVIWKTPHLPHWFKIWKLSPSCNYPILPFIQGAFPISGASFRPESVSSALVCSAMGTSATWGSHRLWKMNNGESQQRDA